MLKKILFLGGSVAIVVVYLFISSHAPEQKNSDLIIFSQVPANDSVELSSNTLNSFENSRIVSLSRIHPEDEISILTSKLYSAAFPSISFDNSLVVFSARLNAGEPWQLWTMKTNGGSKKQLTYDSLDCIHPIFLPDGKILFSRAWENELGKGYHLYTYEKQGLGISQISFHPHQDLYPTMLHDGRVSLISSQVFPEELPSKLMTIRPDGTKCDLFYKGPGEHQVISKVVESADKNLFFIERCDHGDALVKTAYSNPELTRVELLHQERGGFQSVTSLASGNLIISYKPVGDTTFGLFEYREDEKSEPVLMYSNRDFHSIDPIAAEVKVRPKSLPTTVDAVKNSGIIICQNSNESRISIDENITDDSAAFIQVLGLKELIGEIGVEIDGSFLLQLPPDEPVRFQSLNKEREILRGPSSWIWLRPNERRGCVGCHQKNEFAPENKLPIAISKSPAIITGKNAQLTTGNVSKEGGENEN